MCCEKVFIRVVGPYLHAELHGSQGVSEKCQRLMKVATMHDSDLPKSALAMLLVDFINPLDFPGAEDLAEPAVAAARSASKLARWARSHDIPVIYANDNFGSWRSNFDAMVGRLIKSSGAGATLVRLLRPRRGDLTVLKPMHSAFYGTPLDIILDKMGTRSIILTGLAADICIQLTAADAFLRDIKVHVPNDCTASETLCKKEAALGYMKEILKCQVRSSSEIMAQRRSH